MESQYFVNLHWDELFFYIVRKTQSSERQRELVVSQTPSAIVIYKMSTLPDFFVKLFKGLLEVEFPIDWKSI